MKINKKVLIARTKRLEQERKIIQKAIENAQTKIINLEHKQATEYKRVMAEIYSIIRRV